MCSPRGSIDHGYPPDSAGSSTGLNSVEITSPRLHSKPSDVEMNVLDELEHSHKVTQTDLNQDQHANLLQMEADGKNDIIAVAEDEVLIDKTDKKKKGKRSHRILINLDDKNRFTDEITV